MPEITFGGPEISFGCTNAIFQNCIFSNEEQEQAARKNFGIYQC
jgi:hypothetical protein